MPPLPGPVDFVLHIGSDKTGTTSIQGFLRHNRAALAEAGWLFPRTLGQPRHLRFGMFTAPDEALVRSQDWFRGGYGDLPPAEFRQRVRRRLFREIREAAAEGVLISDEALFSASWERVDRLRLFTDRFARSVRVVVYLRRQDDHLVSSYQQVIKRGEVDRLSAWVQRDRRRFYDYHRRLCVWRDHLEPDAMVVRRFERPRFVGGDLVADFLTAADLGVDRTSLEPTGTRNESLSAEAVEMLRLLNLHQVEDLGKHPWQISNARHVARLKELPGPTLTLPDHERDRIMSACAESNRAVARDFLGETAAELFASPRPKKETTDVQRLDPARVEDHLALLEVPREHHAAIQRIAEREAAGD